MKPSPSWAEGLTRKLGTLATGTMAAITLSFALSVVVARLLGPRQLAGYSTLLASILLLGQLNDVGLGNAYAFFARHRSGALPVLLRILFRHIAICVTLVGTAMAAVMLFGPDSWKESVSPPAFAAVIVIFVGATTAANVLPVLVLARAEYATYVGFSTLTTILQLAGVLVAFRISGASWRAFISALALVQVVIVASEAFYLLSRAPAAEPHTVSARECYLYGLRIKWAEIMKLLSGRVDILVVALVLPPTEVGLYAVALSFRELGMTPLRIYNSLFQNLLVDRQRDQAGDRDLIIGSLVMLTILSLVLVFAAVAIFPIALPLIYGRAYAALAWPATILFAGTLFLSVAGLCWTVFNMQDRPGLTSAIVTVLGLVSPLLLWLLAHHAGLIGAASAGVAGGALVCAISLGALVKLKGYAAHDVVEVTRRVPALFRELRNGAVSNARRMASQSMVGPS